MLNRSRFSNSIFPGSTRIVRRASCGAWLGLLMLAAWCACLHAGTSPTLRIVSVEHLAGNQLRLVFQETGTNVLDYRLTHRLDLSSGTTNNLDLGARISDLGGGLYQTIIPEPPNSPRFYRIAGFSGADTDGDGLADTLEALIGTSPSTFDTDRDGVGDGVELAHSANPLNASSKPFILQAQFAETSSSAREGQSTVSLAVTFNTNYTGTLHYQIADMSTAVSGEDFVPVSGSVPVMGSSVLIPITLLDDTNLEPVKMLAVDIVKKPSSDFEIGGASRHVVQLFDNDSAWAGVMGTTNSSQLGFKLRMLRVGGQVLSAALVSELSTNSSQGIGTIPVGVWPVQVTLTSNSFSAVSAPIPMGTSRLTGSALIQRVITFTAAAGNTNHLVRTNLIIGTFTDQLQSSGADSAWVGGNMTGTVVLVEDLPVPAPRAVPGQAGLRKRTIVSAQGGAQ